MRSEADRELTEIVRPHNNDREREVVVKAVNKALGGILHEQAARNVACRVLLALRTAANLDAEEAASRSLSQEGRNVSNLRFFADTMYDLIEHEWRLQEIAANAKAYTDRCLAIRNAHLPSGDRPSPSFHAATEGANAARIILAEVKI